MDITYVTAFDNSKLALYTWDDVGDQRPRAVVQLAEGMMEHAGRYDDFARFLNEHGIVVVAQDFRGFGKSAPLEENGVYAGDWYGDSLRDELDLNKRIRKEYKDLPIVFFGHSAGSYIGQYLIQQPEFDVTCVILCGTSYMKSKLYPVVQRLVAAMTAVIGYEKPANWLNKLIFGQYDKAYRDEGKNAWLSRDVAQVEKYNEDPYCGRPCSYGFYRSFLGFNRFYQEEGLARIPRDLPIFLIAGENDQLNGGKGEGVKRLATMYGELGINDVEVTLYPGARHEIMNEIMNFEVYEDVLNYISGHVRGQES